jgi:L-alanine-DL-glutamate epimerase-like enolase superfamily enzyme
VSGSLYAKISALPLEISRVRLEPLSMETAAGWRRCTTLVRLEGGGLEGVGEDVDYREANHQAFRSREREVSLEGGWTVDRFSRRVDRLDLSPGEALYRRWAFESAALDLALRQAGLSLAEALGREARPVQFVVSQGLGDPPAAESLDRVLRPYPGTRFKLDLSEGWTRDLVAGVAGRAEVAVIDLKGLYRGEFSGPRADPVQYRYVAEGFGAAWIEDPEWNEETGRALDPFRDRITWDAKIHAVADIVGLPFQPAAINMKPSRFGFLSELLRAYEYCQARSIRMYGGGQFELGAGRGQAQHLASLFHPDGPNDLAPAGYNRVDPGPDLGTSPLSPPPDRPGFGWG